MIECFCALRMACRQTSRRRAKKGSAATHRGDEFVLDVTLSYLLRCPRLSKATAQSRVCLGEGDGKTAASFSHAHPVGRDVLTAPPTPLLPTS